MVNLSHIVSMNCREDDFLCIIIADDKTRNKSTLHNCVTDSSHLKIVSVTDKDKPQSMEKNQLNETHLFCGHPQLPLLTLGISKTSKIRWFHFPPPSTFDVPSQVGIQVLICEGVEEEQAAAT